MLLSYSACLLLLIRFSLQYFVLRLCVRHWHFGLFHLLYKTYMLSSGLSQLIKCSIPISLLSQINISFVQSLAFELDETQQLRLQLCLSQVITYADDATMSYRSRALHLSICQNYQPNIATLILACDPVIERGRMIFMMSRQMKQPFINSEYPKTSWNDIINHFIQMINNQKLEIPSRHHN